MGRGVAGPEGTDPPRGRAAVQREIARQIEQFVLCLLVGQWPAAVVATTPFLSNSRTAFASAFVAASSPVEASAASRARLLLYRSSASFTKPKVRAGAIVRRTVEHRRSRLRADARCRVFELGDDHELDRLHHVEVVHALLPRHLARASGRSSDEASVESRARSRRRRKPRPPVEDG